jgi:tetratricopeptide (TPR) repeat protein
MKNMRTLPFLLAGLICTPAGAADILRYAEPGGVIKTAPVEILRKESATEFNARIRVAGRLRTLKIPTRLVIDFARGSTTDINQWSKQLAKARRLMAAGQIATKDKIPGAEEFFTKIAYSTEKGTKGQEATEEIHPWHNMYALFGLIQARYKLGLQGAGDKFDAALADIEQFAKRSAGKYRKTVAFDVPGAEGSIETKKIYSWGENRLSLEVQILKARILAAQDKADEAAAAYDAALDTIKKKGLSPVLLTQCVVEKADLKAKGKGSEEQEQLYASAGNTLAGMASGQPDQYGKNVLRRASNLALLKGADLLLKSAEEGKLSFDPPLQRYRNLKAGKGSQDRAVYMGAQTGIGICLVAKEQGKQGYEALLDVVTHAADFPDQAARAMYYLRKAAQLYAKEVDGSGGNGGFLREEADRWAQDLKDRYPTSEWATKGSAK